MPPNVGSSPLSMTITLTPVRGFGEARTLVLKPGEPCLIGRASKSSVKNLEPSRHNGLFDCPVISREHAELRAHMWDAVENQVTITDKGSMHGTRVNGAKLREGCPKTLHSGDTIEFGDKVTRGDSSHDGIMVTFSHRPTFTQESNTFDAHTPTANPGGTFRYPYTSDEESDYGSDDDLSVMSDKGDIEEVSSAKTTPEQAKAKLGTQEQPIDLDQPEKAKRTLVQDSLDAQASVIVPESLPALKKKSAIPFIDVDSDDESVAIRQNAPPIPPRPRAESYVSIEQDADEQDEVEYLDNDVLDIAEEASDSEVSELDHYGQADDSDEEDDDEVPARRSLSPDSERDPSPAPQGYRPRSPELLSSGQNRPAVPSSAAETYSPSRGWLNAPLTTSFGSQPHEHNRPQVLPASQPHACSYSSGYGGYNYQPALFTSSANLDQPLNNTARYAASANAGMTYHSLPETSRWDKPPSFTRIAPVPAFTTSAFGSSRYYAPSQPSDNFDSSNTWVGAPSQHANSQFATGFPSTCGVSSSKVTSHATATQGSYYPQSPSIPPQSPEVPTLAPTTSRISIPDIVENETEMEDDTTNFLYGNVEEQDADMVKKAQAMAGGAREMVEKIKASEVTAIPAAYTAKPAGTKRKADDVEDLTHATRSGFPELGTQISRHDVDDAAALGAEVPSSFSPVSKKAKTSEATPTPTFEGTLPPPHSALATAGSVAGSIAKYAAVASAGGAGMLAFLCSPASEQLLNWLS